MLTATRTTVLNTLTNASPDALWTTHFYDGLGRETKTYQQHYLGGTVSANNYDVVSNTYNFTNQVTTTTRLHKKNVSGVATLALTIFNKYLYDHVGRKLKTWEQLTNGTSTPDTLKLLSKTDYNEIGQVLTKHLHSKDSVTFFQDVAYTYNERGWLLTSSAQLWAMKLYYNAASSAKSYNGNIMYQYWGPSLTNLNNHYSYTYDNLNRLMAGSAADGNGESSIAYDQMGNITALKRYATSTLIDNLSYTYTKSGNPTNQLQSISDASGNNGGLAPGTWTYTYDGNGNLSASSCATNTNKSKSFTYNLLNLPQTINRPDTSVTYVYDASGKKLRKLTVFGSTTNATDYIDGIQYDGATTPTISFIQTEEGRALTNGSATNHLGDARVAFDTDLGFDHLTQTDNYYPFGQDINLSNIYPKNEYLYNKKELQEESGLYDYGRRYYDPLVARWMEVDPLAENDRRWTPYGYGFDNSIRFEDPDGMWPDLGAIASTANDLIGGAINAFASDATGAEAPTSRHSSANSYNTGRIIGHVAAMVVGTLEMEGGGTAAAGGVVAAPETGGLSLVATAGGAAAIAHGAMTIKNAMVNMVGGEGNDKGEGTKGASKGSLTGTKEALTEAKQKIGLKQDETLAKGDQGKFGSPQRGDGKKGYRLDPAHPNAKPESGEEHPHVNYWDYTKGKRDNGGINGAVPIKQ